MFTLVKNLWHMRCALGRELAQNFECTYNAELFKRLIFFDKGTNIIFISSHQNCPRIEFRKYRWKCSVKTSSVMENYFIEQWKTNQFSLRFAMTKHKSNTSLLCVYRTFSHSWPDSVCIMETIERRTEHDVLAVLFSSHITMMNCNFRRLTQLLLSFVQSIQCF